jgi:hypothetical protein
MSRVSFFLGQSWLISAQRFLDISLAQSHAAELNNGGVLQTFMARMPADGGVGMTGDDDWLLQAGMPGPGFSG